MERHQISKEQIAHNAYSNLLKITQKYLDPSSEDVLRKAFEFAHQFHADQTRKSGEPYIIHPLAVAEILAEYSMDETSLIAAILHDVVEDTHVTLEQIEKLFGADVTRLVDGLTKLSKIQFHSSEEKMAENFRKMILAMSKDIRVLIIKLADRTHNMRTIRALASEKRRAISEETIEIYAPLAGRLGMHKIKAELEDLSFRELKPSVYYQLVTKVKNKRAMREQVIENAKNQLSEKIQAANIPTQIYGRAKHFYSIYKKISEKKIEFEDIYDLFALRVIVNSIAECYEVLGIIHNTYRPVPGRFKDYIALPKANLYQSLHTTVVAAKGELLEIQIRTEHMHEIAENGIAAHWLYKEMRGAQNNKTKLQEIEKFSWLKQMLNHEKELSDPNEFLEAVKVDLFDDEVYVFSPKGDVFELKKGATCLDFAFAVHTDIGLRTTGAKVNGRIASLRGRLFSGDVVELIVSSKIRATKDWLNFTITSKARNKIRTYLRTQEREQTNSQTEVSTAELVPKQTPTPTSILPLSTATSKSKNHEDSIIVSGFKDVLVRRAKCCEPLPEQPIVGFVSRGGKGVIVHVANCQWAFLNNPGRRVECMWDSKVPNGHEITLKILAHDKLGVLAELTKAVTGMQMNISKIDCMTNAQKRAIILLKIELQNLNALKEVHQKIEAVDGVINVERVLS